MLSPPPAMWWPSDRDAVSEPGSVVSPDAESTDTLILEFQPLEPRGVSVYCSKPPVCGTLL